MTPLRLPPHAPRPSWEMDPWVVRAAGSRVGLDFLGLSQFAFILFFSTKAVHYVKCFYK